MTDADLDRLRVAVDGQFRVEHEIGRGGMGIVYRAHDLKLDRAVAIKLLPDAIAADATLRERFLREARTAAKLTHPNIVPVFRADDADGVAYIVMALIDGETLADRVRIAGPLAAPDVVPMLADAARALGYAHAHGVIHRDVKPENILIERATGRAVVTDFGIARAVMTGDAATPLTSTGQVMGTALFMSPEQALGEPLDGRSDLYSLGAVGYCLLTGHAPFEGAAAAVLVAHVTRAPAPLPTSVPPALSAVIMRCLAKSPADRPATGDALAEALADALQAPASSPRRPEAPAPPSPRLPDADAARVWERAATLQAEATGGYSITQVEESARDVGIAPTYVALALSELAVERASGQPAVPSLTDRIGPAVLGATSGVLTASITIPYPPDRVREALARTVRDAPYRLELMDVVEGIYVFALPAPASMFARPDSPAWTYTVQQMGIRHLRVALVGDGGATTVTMFADIRRPRRMNVVGAMYLDICGGAAGVGMGVAAALKLALTGVALVGLTAGVAIPVTAAAVAAVRALWAHNRRGAVAEMRRALESVQSAVRTADVLGILPDRRPSRDPATQP